MNGSMNINPLDDTIFRSEIFSHFPQKSRISTLLFYSLFFFPPILDQFFLPANLTNKELLEQVIKIIHRLIFPISRIKFLSRNST